MRTLPRDLRLIVPVSLLIFGALALLAGFFVAGEARKAQILLEYSADRTAAALLDDFRALGTLDASQMDPGITAFGVYRADGAAVIRVGGAPAVLESEDRAGPFRYDRAGAVLTLIRPIALGGPAMQGGTRSPPGAMGRMMGSIGGRGRASGQGGVFLLRKDIGSYYRGRRLYGAATVLSPALVAAVAGAFLFLLSSNLRYRRAALERETLARLGESARTLAHEIRNPLGAIRLQTSLMRRSMPAGGSAELDIIDEETERLSLLSRRVGDFLKSPGGVPERIVLVEFLRDAAHRSPHGVRLGLDSTPVLVRFDPELLRSVIENLVRNAYESYPEADTNRNIDLWLTRADGRVAITVSDRGMGIPAGSEERVFDPFYTDKIHGSGIGLSLSRRFVEAAGGSLTITSRPGGGTEARIILPEEKGE